MEKALEGKSPVKFPVPDKIKFATVDVQTGYFPDELSVSTMQVAVKEDVELSAPLVVSEDQEPNETDVLPEPANTGYIKP